MQGNTKSAVSNQQDGFTLIELLVVLIVIAILAAIIFPVFANVRERGRRTTCASNEKQLGMALLAYAGDYDETFPHGDLYGGGDGWGAKVFPYVKSTQVFHCPDDETVDQPGEISGDANSYGLNSNISGFKSFSPKAISPSGRVGLPQVAATSNTVLLFEVSHCVAILTDPQQDTQSAAGTGAEGHSLDQSDPTYPLGQGDVAGGLPLYATGNMGGRVLNGATKGGKLLPGAVGSVPRHGGGANYVACDGHVQWLRPEQVSSGVNSVAADCLQGTQSPQPADCTTQEPDNAAGTASGHSALTFSRI